MRTNFGAAAKDYAKFRAGFPESIFDRLADLDVIPGGKTIVDIGTGTGTLARGFALRGGKVIGIDPDARLLDQAKELDASAGVKIEYKTGSAEDIPLPDGVAEIISAGQCWHWFDGPAAAEEIARVTKRDGRVIVAHFDWIPLPGNMVEATERLILKHNPSWHLGGGNGFHPESSPHLHAAGFSQFESFSYDIDVPYSPEAWRGRIRASAGVGASLPPKKVDAFDAELAALLKRSFPGDPLQVPHRVFALVGKRTD